MKIKLCTKNGKKECFFDMLLRVALKKKERNKQTNKKKKNKKMSKKKRKDIMNFK